MNMPTLAFQVERAKEWLAVSCTGDFSGFVMGKELGIDTPGQLDLVLADLRDLGLIEPTGGKHGMYARVNSECQRIEWKTATQEYYPIWLPFGLHDMCGVRSKNIIVVSGETNAGKTLWALEVVYKNLAVNGGAHDEIYYWNSEMAADEMRPRLTGIAPVDSWRGLEPFERTEDFHSVIKPDSLNIIDYLEISDNFYKIGGMIQKIHAKLRKGVCIILIQKGKGRDFGRGGEFTAEKCRLGLAISYNFGVNTVKLTKCKNPKQPENPQGKELDYRITRGVSTDVVVPWRYVTEKDRKNTLAYYEQQQVASRQTPYAPSEDF